jgi:hypothetical protein
MVVGQKQAFPKHISEHSYLSFSFPEMIRELGGACIKGTCLKISIRLDNQIKTIFLNKLYKADPDNSVKILATG